MRIVVWNCNMAFHRKAERLWALQPDIAVVPECADISTLQRQGLSLDTGRSVWVGHNRNKGLAVFAGENTSLRINPDYDPANRIIAPIEIGGPRRINVLAVWSSSDRDLPIAARGEGPILRALRAYQAFTCSAPLVVAGDFNHNVRWDRPGRANNHAHVVSLLEQMGLTSIYHAHRNVQQGREQEPTIYWRDRKADGPSYHIDYVFIPKAWLPRVMSVTLGQFDEWVATGLSDHVPLIVDVDI